MLARLRGVKREAAVRIKDVVMMKMIRSQLRITLSLSLSLLFTIYNVCWSLGGAAVNC